MTTAALKSTTSPESLAPTSPFSSHSLLSSSSVSNNSALDSPQFITSATYKKPTAKHVTQLSTSSAEGIAVANQCTPERLAHLLLITGPLAIRHITSNLAKQIQGFDKLSLSKQRRLIMTCLNQGHEDEAIIFEKIGWGQWRAKKVDPVSFVKERNAVRIANAKVKDSEGNGPVASTSALNSAAANARRESITKNKYDLDTHDKLLNKKSKKENMRDTTMDNDYAIASDEDEEEEEEEGSSSSEFSDVEADEGVFEFDDDDHIPPLRLNGRLISPPMNVSSSRRSSQSRGIQKPKFKTLRSNSQTPTSPELLYTYGGKKDTKSRTRRNSSIRSTLSNENAEEESETDEEDWQAIGAVKLRRNIEGAMEIDPKFVPGILEKQEQDAAAALINLRSV